VTGSISRKLYRHCLLLYPKSFRHEFEDEMLDMFEDCRAAQGSCRLLGDVVFSAAKQQIIERSTPLQKSAPLYAEIAWSRKLARVFALVALGAGLITAAVVDRETPEAPESWTLLHTQHRLWWPAALQQPSCSEAR
jgi:hypothetical protein